MNTVVSRDGTTIAFDRQGNGPAVILITGALDDGSENAPLAVQLAGHFTVYNYARRGRGNSGNTLPYELEREIEDIQALITEAGGLANIYGVSSGGMFALEAAAAGLAIDRLAVYEVPYDTAEGAPDRFAGYRRQLDAILAQGRRGDAVELFMRLAGSSDEDVVDARKSPYWAGLEGLAHTLPYDAVRYGEPPRARLATIDKPVLVMSGGSVALFEAAADAVAASIPGAERRVLDGEAHTVDPEVMASELIRFFRASAS